MPLRPVFIAGCDRSGTTMLGDILGSASDSFATPESQWIHEYLLISHLQGFADTLHAARWLKAHFRFAVWDLALSDEQLAALIDLTNPRVTIDNVIGAYLKQHGRDPEDNLWWCDHTPDNFKFYALLKSCFPAAKYIHIVRDGRAVFQSIKPLDWGPNNAYMGTRYWTTRVQQALMVEVAEGSNCYRIRYEDILRNPEEALSRLCEFTGQAYHEPMLDGGGLILPEFTQNQHKLVGKRPDASRLENWRNGLSKTEIVEFESYPWSRMIMEKMGYTMDTAEPSIQRFYIVVYRYFHDSFMYLWNRRKHIRMEKKKLRSQ